MNFEQIRSLVGSDMKIDSSELDVESLRTPQLHNKYLNIFHDERLILKKLNVDYAELKKSKWEYYTGKMSLEELKERDWEPFQFKILKTDVDRYLDADKDLVHVRNKIMYQEEKVEYLASVLKSISSRQWDIKNAIDFRKFINGVS